MDTLFSTNRKFKRMFVNILSIIVILAIAFPVGTASAQEANPRIVASVIGDWFWTADFMPGTLNLFIYESADEGAALLWSGAQDTDPSGFTFVGYDVHGRNLVPGNYLVVSDGVHEKRLVLEMITMEVFDTSNEIMAGTASPGKDVWVAAGPQDWQQGIMVTAEPISGAWRADFKTLEFDITEEMRPWSYAQVFDDDGDANEADPPPAPPSTWRDDFDGSLRDGWYWKNGDAGQWNLGDMPGFLRMYASDTSTPDGNLLLRGVANEDFTIKTHLLFEPNTNFQFAGLVIWQDENNFLQFGRAFCDIEGSCVGNGIYFDKILGGNFADSNFATEIGNPSDVYLRLERRGDMVRAFYSVDEGISWYEIGTHWIPSDFQVKAVGLTASQDDVSSNIPADFDFFELTEGWGFLPEGFHDYDQGDVPSWACNAGGWAADPDDRAARVNVDIVVDDQTVASLVAGEFRQDLLDAGVCEGGNCGFSTGMWGAISSYEPHRVDAWAQDDTGEWVLLSNSAKTLTCRTYDIYAYDPLSGQTKQITNSPGTDEYNPSWSPNGKKVAHDVLNADGSYGIYITDVKTGITTPLTGADNGGNDAVWSPNGKWIAFDLGAWSETPDLYLVPATGGVPTLVRTNAVSADWAPSGKRLVFQQPGDGSIRTIAVDGGDGGETLIAESGANPVWSPDGNWIAFENNGDIWKVQVNVQGTKFSEPVQMTHLIAQEGQPTWSADGQTIIFAAGLDRDVDLWSVPSAGGDPTWLTGAWEFGDYDPSGAKNSPAIAYASFSPNGQAARQWIAAYTHDAGPWSEGPHSYHFEATWNGGGETTPEVAFNVSSTAPSYNGYILLRGLALRANIDGSCSVIDPNIRSDQLTRFHTGYVTDYPMTYEEALMYFASLSAKAIWDGGAPVDLVPHEIMPYRADQWPTYYCSFTSP